MAHDQVRRVRREALVLWTGAVVVALGLAWAVPALFGNAPLRNVGRRIPGTGAMVTLAVGIVALASLGRAILDGRARRAERRRQQGPPADDRR